MFWLPHLYPDKQRTDCVRNHLYKWRPKCIIEICEERHDGLQGGGQTIHTDISGIGLAGHLGSLAVWGEINALLFIYKKQARRLLEIFPFISFPRPQVIQFWRCISALNNTHSSRKVRGPRQGPFKLFDTCLMRPNRLIKSRAQ
jgi:hypothetical protein